MPLLDSLAGRPGLAAGALDRVRRRAAQLLPAVPDRDFADGVVTHGDVHPANVLGHQGRVVALLDLEWARTGPPDLELESVCRENPAIEERLGPGPVEWSEVPVLRWMRAAYPALFGHAGLTERVWLYQLCYQVRQVHLAEAQPADIWPAERLSRLAAQPLVRFA